VIVAILHKAVLRPTKLELLAAWLPSQPWYPVDDARDVGPVSAFRFDDPAGEVGIETLIVRAGDGPLIQVPLTYRAAPLRGGERWLIGTSDHSVLGKRWVYDACGDPVYAAALATAILAGRTQAEQFYEVDGRLEPKHGSAQVIGSGSPGTEVASIDVAVPIADGSTTVIKAAGLELKVFRVLDDSVDTAGSHTLTGTWDDGDTRLTFASVY
jgi:hypothetical protein